MRNASLVLVVCVVGACGNSQPPPREPCPATTVVATAAPLPSASPAPSASESVDPNVTRSVIGDSECLRYAPGYPEYLGIRCVLALGPSGHPEYVFQSVTHHDLFIRVDTHESTVEGIERAAGLRFPRVWIDRVVDCFDDAIEKDAKLSGTVTISYEIGKDGRPQNVKPGTGSLKAVAVTTCAAKLVQHLHYPPQTDASKPAPKITLTAMFRTSSSSKNEAK